MGVAVVPAWRRRPTAPGPFIASVDATHRSIDDAIAKAQGRYFGTRMLGFAIAIVGSGLLAAANLV